MTPDIRLNRSTSPWVPAMVAGWAASVATAPGLATKLLLAVPPSLLVSAWWILLDPERWISVLFFSLVLLPPMPAAVGNSGVSLAPFVALLGLASGALRFREWKRLQGWLPLLVLLFPAILLGSTALAALYSGWAIAAGSLARVLLFAIGVYVFLYALAGPRQRDSDPFTPLKWLFRFAMLAALFACLDFYFQLPLPAGQAPQFVWLDTGVFRRAQGLFYEASTLGNFCAFFLVMVLVAYFLPRQNRPVSRPALAGGFVLFSAALMLSYSRGSAVNVAVAAFAFLLIRNQPARRLLRASVIPGILLAALLRYTVPEFFSHYITRLAVSFQYFGEYPDRILSGRLASWGTIAGFLRQHPWTAILGIGYKTLPYSSYAGTGLVADNTYLSLLVETGIVGVGIFLLLNAAILRTAWRAARSPQNRASFFGSWMFCFWCGELVQMASGDLITYWRVLPLYWWVLAIAARESAA